MTADLERPHAAEFGVPGRTRAFSLNGVNFIIDISPGPARRPSDSSAFTIVKAPEVLEFYRSLARSVKPRGILELGIFQGGSYVLLDQLFQPTTIAALDISQTPVPALMSYVTGKEGRYVHFASSQSDAPLIRRIVAEECRGELDLVVDDASHLYDLSRQSFEIIFPLLAPGGYYIVEDWKWAHQKLYQNDNGPRFARPALTNLLFELTLLLGSTNLIESIKISGGLFVVKKAANAGSIPADFWRLIANRGRQLSLV